jgi:hypothetical protein
VVVEAVPVLDLAVHLLAASNLLALFLEPNPVQDSILRLSPSILHPL